MSRRKDVLEKLMASKTLSQDGKDWLTLALDPFHDYNHQIAGFPDADGSHTVVACYEYQVPITKPNGVVGNWDAHVFISPLANAESLWNGSLNAGWTRFIQQGVTSAVMGPVTVYASEAGGCLFPNGVTLPVTQMSIPSGANATDLAFGITRIVGMGFEIHNTTADMYKQGSIACYRMPNNPSRTNLCVTDNGLTWAYQSAGQLYRSPPTTTQDALLLKGTVSWPAADGAYVVGTMNTVSNKLSNFGSDSITLTSASGGVAGVALTSAMTNVAASGVLTFGTTGIRKTTTMDTSGVILSGLSEQTSLRITVKFYVERAPTHAESNLAVVATPSAQYDLAALELYSHAIAQLPVAAKVGENARGDWWRSVLNTIADVATPLGTALTPFVPNSANVASIIAKGARTAAGTMAQRPDSSASAMQVARGIMSAAKDVKYAAIDKALADKAKRRARKAKPQVE